MLIAHNWRSCVPKQVRPLFEDAVLHSIVTGERAILARLRTLTDAEFQALPYGSEGLWRKFMHACRKEATLEAIIAATKSKRYTRTRIDRMVMCAFLGITCREMAEEVPYTRVLAFNDRGREILSTAKKDRLYLNTGERREEPYWQLEQRCGSLYGLFCEEASESPDAETMQRVFYQK
jgi:predicted nucleotidyltransferase